MSDLKNSVTPPVFYYQPAGVPMALQYFWQSFIQLAIPLTMVQVVHPSIESNPLLKRKKNTCSYNANNIQLLVLPLGNLHSTWKETIWNFFRGNSGLETLIYCIKYGTYPLSLTLQNDNESENNNNLKEESAIAQLFNRMVFLP